MTLRSQRRASPVAPDQRRIVREAFAHADQVDRAIVRAFPDPWGQMDRMRASNGTDAPWSDWCLLPMAAAALIVSANPLAAVQGLSIARVAASYAWRYTRSVYLMEPSLLDRLLHQVPDAIGLDDLATLPEWCIYLAAGDPEVPGGGVWAHLEHDMNTSRPELRLLLDIGEMPLPIPVYLDRPSMIEALADFRATTLATLNGPPGANVRGGELDATVAAFAENVDGYLGVLAYLARPEADIVNAHRPGVRPVRSRKAKRGTEVWLVGYSQ